MSPPSYFRAASSWSGTAATVKMSTSDDCQIPAGNEEMIVYLFSILISLWNLQYLLAAFGFCSGISQVATLVFACCFLPAWKGGRALAARQCEVSDEAKRASYLHLGAAACLAAMVHCLIHGKLDFYGDEYFRLSMAQAIRGEGLPVAYSWFLSGSKAHMNTYALTEWIAVQASALLGEKVSLEQVYLSLLPGIGRFLFIALCLDFVSRCFFTNRHFFSRHPSRLSWQLAVTVLSVLFLFFGAPFLQAMSHIGLRQTAFSLAIVCAIVILLFDQALFFRRTQRLPDSLTLSLPCSLLLSLISVKLLMFTVAGVAVGVFACVLSFVARSLRPLLTLTIACVLALAIYWHAPVGPATKGHWLVGIFLDREENFFSLLPYRGMTQLIALGGLSLPICAVATSRMWKRREYVALWMSGTLVAAVAAAYSAGLMLRYSTATGGAEAYWLICGWLLMGMLTVFCSVHCICLRGWASRVSILCMIIQLSFSLFQMRDNNFRDEDADVKQAFCARISDLMKSLNFDSHLNFVLVQPWRHLRAFTLLAGCPIRSIVIDSHFGALDLQPGFSRALQLNNALVTNADIASNLEELEQSQLGVDGVFLVRKKGDPLRNPDVAVLSSERNYQLYGPIWLNRTNFPRPPRKARAIGNERMVIPSGSIGVSQ